MAADEELQESGQRGQRGRAVRYCWLNIAFTLPRKSRVTCLEAVNLSNGLSSPLVGRRPMGNSKPHQRVKWPWSVEKLPPSFEKNCLDRGIENVHQNPKIENVVYRASWRDEISTNFSSVSFSTATLFSPIVQRGSGLPPSIF
jgi:hypothetical protein